ncbi:SLBB domain-containing protein [Cyanobium sp. Alchichica 3B3-8F6]|nr:SLBB domain-containing protein [Cyanobium sp. Alchichica 3B3-8F6]
MLPQPLSSPVRGLLAAPLLSALALAQIPGLAAMAQPQPAAEAAQAGAVPLGAVQALADDAYILGPGDVLGLQIFDALELSGNLDVLNDGSVSLPLIGSVRVVGLTLSQAQQWFSTLMARQLQRPELLLRVVRPRPIRVALVGEVERPGIYSLTTSETAQTEGGPALTLSGLPTVVDAIQKAGGITLNANLRQVQLQRRLPGDAPLYKRARLDLLALIREGDQQQNPFLFDGDTIRIGKAEQPVEEAVEVAAANLSPQQIQVNVVGEVVSPGRIQVPASLPLVQAVLAAGGPRAGRASDSNVELIRINRNGTAARQRFRLNLAQGASNAQNPPLRDGDTVIVNRSGMAVATDTISAVTTPLTGLASILALIDIVNRN